MGLFNDFIHKFPDSLNVKFGPNLQKMVRFVSESFDEINDLHQQIEDYREIDKATGKALDRLGAKYAQERGQANDEFYRIMIKSKIMVRNGDASVNGILRVIQNSMNAPVDGVKVQPLRAKPTDPTEPLALSIYNIPLDITTTDWEKSYLFKRIKEGVAIGIRVDNILYRSSSASDIYVGQISKTVPKLVLPLEVDTTYYEESSTSDVYVGQTSKTMIRLVLSLEVDTTYYHEQSETQAMTGQLVKTSVTYRI